MTSVESILLELEKRGNERTRRAYAAHGVSDATMYGVRISDLKKIAKGIKGRQDLALELYRTGNVDAMYLAGLVADGTRMGKRELGRWVKAGSVMPMISEYTVPWVAVESAHARELAFEWIASRIESVSASGWCTYAGIVATRPDSDLDLGELAGLLDEVVNGIATARNRVRYTMNGFVIAVGAYVEPLLGAAREAARRIGKVDVDMGDTACKVPLATAYIEKIESMGRVGKKRRTIRC